MGKPVVLLLLVLTIVSQMMPGLANHHSNDQQSIARINLTSAIEIEKHFFCNKSQPRTHKLTDLMQHLHSIKVQLPKYIVLKRCDTHSGCCQSAVLTCAPSSIYYEDIEIMIVNVGRRKRANNRRWIRVKQHGNCTCKELDDNHETDTEPPVELINPE